MSRNNKKQQRLKQTTEEYAPFVFEGDYDLAIIGGGASGLACALACAQEAQRLASARLRIVVLEAGKRLGTSILRSGNGRCNFSHARVNSKQYWNAEFAAEVFANLQQCANMGKNPVLRMFEQLGLVWREAPNSGGLLYPYSNKAFSVLEVLQAALDEYQVEIHTNSQVVSLEKRGSAFCLGVEQTGATATAATTDTMTAAATATAIATPAAGKHTGAQNNNAAQTVSARIKNAARVESICAKKVVFAAGGSWDKALLANLPGISDAYIPSKPVLGPLRTTFLQGVAPKTLDGIRMHARLSVPERAFAEEGEILFREYGISGIVTFNASRYAQPEDVLLLDLAPEISQNNLQAMLERRAYARGPNKEQLFKGFLLPQVAQAVFCAAGMVEERITETSAKTLVGLHTRDNNKTWQAADFAALARAIKAFPLTVVGIADERQCQVKRGGINPQVINDKTLEARCAPGLYVLGEALDVDGPCGGYNLHWAWATGLLSGLSIARSIVGDVR